MEFGSFAVLCDETEERETIFADEVADGIASCADEQAQVWRAAAMEEGREEDFFLRELGKLTRVCLDEKKRREDQEKKAADASSSGPGSKPVGAFGCVSRLQPRFAGNGKNERKFDAIVEARVREEVAAASAKQRMYADLSRLDPSLPPLPPSSSSSLPCDFASSLTSSAAADVVVIDIGTSMIRAGFGGDDAPRSIFPTLVGRPRHAGVMIGMGCKSAYVGDEAQSKRGILTVKFPLRGGDVSNWDDFESILHHAFYNELRVAPEEHPCLLLFSPSLSSTSRQKMTQLLFETFNIPALYLLDRSTAALISYQKTSGIVVHLGASHSTLLPIHSLSPQYTSFHSLKNVCGDRQSDVLTRALCERGYSFTTTAERDIVRDMKEKMCFVSLDFHADLSNDRVVESSYELPDGQAITLGNEAFRVPEALFSPSFFSDDADSNLGLVEGIFHSICSLDVTLRREMWQNVVLSGGTSVTRGLCERLQKELRNVAPPTADVAVHASGDRRHASWIGGSIFASLANSLSLFVTSEMYNARGPTSIFDQLDPFYAFSSNAQPPAPLPSPSPAATPSSSSSTSFSSSSSSSSSSQNPQSSPSSSSSASTSSSSSSPSSPPPSSKDVSIVATQPLSNPNVALIRLHSLIGPVSASLSDSLSSSPSLSIVEGRPCVCERCGGALHSHCQIMDGERGSEWKCDFCGFYNEYRPSVTLLQGNKIAYKIPSDRPQPSERREVAGTPSVIICMDTSGSMETKGKTGHSRLESLKTAVLTQLEFLQQHDPKCSVTIVTFGSRVTIIGDDGTKTDVPSHLFARMDTLIEYGRNYGASHSFLGIEKSFSFLEQTVRSLSPNGGTPLGPALSLSVGIAGRLAGSRVMVFTDGVANIGVGLLTKYGDKYDDRSGFYKQIGDASAQRGVTISVVTVADEDCSLENLGVAAERSSGSVDIVDPHEMHAAMKAFLERKTLGTMAKVSLYANPDVVRVTLASTLPNNPANLPRFVTSLDIPVLDERTDVSFFLEPVGRQAMFVDIQLQLHFFTSQKEEVILVVTEKVPILKDRQAIEGDVNSAAISIASIRRAASFASVDQYQDARILLISTQRLLQRTLKSEQNQRDYLSFISQAEKLDQFMRESQRMESLFGKAASRDDGASKSIFSMKSLSHLDFERRS